MIPFHRNHASILTVLWQTPLRVTFLVANWNATPMRGTVARTRQSMGFVPVAASFTVEKKISRIAAMVSAICAHQNVNISHEWNVIFIYRRNSMVYDYKPTRVWHQVDPGYWEYRPYGETTVAEIERKDERYHWTTGTQHGSTDHYADAQAAIRAALRGSSPDITTEAIIGLIRQATQAMADVPGRTPQDNAMAWPLVAMLAARIKGGIGAVAEQRLIDLGADEIEVEAVATVLEELALRLGAWLGRETR